MARPKFAPKSTPSSGRIHKRRYLPHAWTRPTYNAKRHPDPIRRFSTMHWTDRPTDARTYVRTDRQIVHGKVWRLLAAALRQRRGQKIEHLSKLWTTYTYTACFWLSDVCSLNFGTVQETLCGFQCSSQLSISCFVEWMNDTSLLASYNMITENNL